MDAHISSNPLINKPYNIKRPHPTEEAAGETCDGQPSSKKLPESPTHNTEFDSPDLTGDQRGAAFKRLKVIRIPDPEKYLKSPDMLHPDYIGTAAPKELQKHIKHVRKGQRGKQDGGLIYWEYLKAQQTALKALGEEVAKHPSEIIFTMERGGTFLYDCLETYIPEKGRPKAVISTAKLEENTWAATMEYLLRQIQEAYDQGYRRIGLVEVSVTGGQMLYILRHLSEYTEKLERAGAKLETSTELHLYVMQQTIVTSPEFVNSQRKKQETIVSNNSFIHFHSVKTPFLHGEDVDKYLEYGENQTVPVNVIHSEKGLLQLYSDEGPRGTLRNLMAGRYQALESLSEKTVSIKPEDTPDSTTSSEKASRDSQSRMEKLKDVTAQKRLPNFINYPPQPCKIVKKTSETEVLPAQNKQPHNQTPFEQLNVVRITNPEIFIAQPEALTPDFLESPDLEPDEVCRRIELIRKGHRHREGAGIIYWKYLQQQQDALRQMGEKISRAPCEVILTMERGGTLLYDFLEPYIPASARPKIMISTAKPEPKSTSAHIKALIGEATKAYQAGYKKLGIVEVSISGNQLLSITRTLANSFNDVRDPNVELHFYIFKQTLSEREDISKLYGPKQEKVFAESSRMHLHMVKVPYLIGEDVKSQQEYDQELSYPINVIHPKLGFIQLFGSGGTRETLKQLVHGQYSSLDQLDPASLQEMTTTIDMTTTTDKASSLSARKLYQLVLDSHWDGIPTEIEKQSTQYHEYRELQRKMTLLKNWLEKHTEEVHKEYGKLPFHEHKQRFSQYMKKLGSKLNPDSLPPMLSQFYVLRYFHGCTTEQFFSREWKRIKDVLPDIEEQTDLLAKTTQCVGEDQEAGTKQLEWNSCGEVEIVRESYRKIITESTPDRKNANILNFINNKLMKFIDTLCENIIIQHPDIHETGDYQKAVGVTRQILNTAATAIESTVSKKGKRVIRELDQKLSNCLVVLSKTSSEEETAKSLQAIKYDKQNHKKLKEKLSGHKKAKQIQSTQNLPFKEKIKQLAKALGITEKNSLQKIQSKIPVDSKQSELRTDTLVSVADESKKSLKLSAHRIIYDNRQAGIAMKGPVPKEMPAVLRMAEQENVGLFLDLIHDEDRHSDKGFYRFHWAQISDDKPLILDGGYQIRKLGQKIVKFHRLTNPEFAEKEAPEVTVRTFSVSGPNGERVVRQISCPFWPDHKGMPPELLTELIALVTEEKAACEGKQIVVNCLAGLGRTGTFFAAENMAHKLLAGEVTENNLDEMVIDTIMQGKLCRHWEFIQTPTQVRSVRETARHMLQSTSTVRE